MSVQRCSFCTVCFAAHSISDLTVSDTCTPVLQDHFIFTIESTGALHPQDIVRQSIAVLQQKLMTLHDALEHSDEPNDVAANMNIG